MNFTITMERNWKGDKLVSICFQHWESFQKSRQAKCEWGKSGKREEMEAIQAKH